jgi:hypothetical protein
MPLGELCRPLYFGQKLDSATDSEVGQAFCRQSRSPVRQQTCASVLLARGLTPRQDDWRIDDALPVLSCHYDCIAIGSEERKMTIDSTPFYRKHDGVSTNPLLSPHFPSPEVGAFFQQRYGLQRQLSMLSDDAGRDQDR